MTPYEDYNTFNPRKLDTDQWIRAAKAAGVKIAILTATHETGFALYQSDVNPYCMKALKFQGGQGDLVRDFVNSCRKYGIKPGIYIGIRWNSFYGIHDFKVNGNNAFAKNRQRHYNRLCEEMVRELCSRYGELAIVWFDGGAHGPAQGGPDILPIFETHQPNCLFYHSLQRADMRWGGSESGTVPYPCWGTFPHATWFNNRGDDDGFRPIKHGDPDGHYYIPAMSDAPLRGYNGRHEWFWEPGDEAHISPLEQLVEMYFHSVGHNSSLILGLTPNPDGLLPAPDTKRLQEFGEAIQQKFANPIASTAGQGPRLSLILPPNKTVNQVVLMEDISKGERVRKFVLEARTTNGWETLFEGSCIGHKFIHRFEEKTASASRLKISEYAAEPQIKAFTVYHSD